MAVINVNKEVFENQIAKSEKPVLLDFWAPWCGPCRMVGPIIDEIAQENDDILVGKVNVDEETALAAAFGIMSIPTIAVIKNGEVVTKVAGARPKQDILNLLK